MTLPVEQRPVDDDVRGVPGDDVPEHALQVMDSPHFLTIKLSNAREPGETAEATAPTESAGPRLNGLLQIADRDALEYSMHGEHVLKLILWNL